MLSARFTHTVCCLERFNREGLFEFELDLIEWINGWSDCCCRRRKLPFSADPGGVPFTPFTAGKLTGDVGEGDRGDRQFNESLERLGKPIQGRQERIILHLSRCNNGYQLERAHVQHLSH